jgi:type IV secretory pathway protease TraF
LIISVLQGYSLTDVSASGPVGYLYVTQQKLILAYGEEVCEALPVTVIDCRQGSAEFFAIHGEDNHMPVLRLLAASECGVSRAYRAVALSGKSVPESPKIGKQATLLT